MPRIVYAQASSAAQQAAKQLYKDAQVEADEKKFATACPKFEKVLKELPEDDRVAMSVANCYFDWGKLNTALGHYKTARVLAESKGKRDKVEQIDKLLPELEKRIPTLLIRVSSNVKNFPDAVVSLDGTPIPPSQWNQAIAVDPGDHEIEAMAPDQSPLKIPIHVPEGKQTEAPWVAPPWIAPTTPTRPPTPSDPPKNPSVTIPPTNPTPIAPTVDNSSKATSLRKDSKTSEGTSGMRVGGQALLVIGGGSFLVGSALGILAISKYSSASDDGHCDANDVCDAVGTQLRNNAKSFGYGSGVSFAIAIPSLIVGGVLFSKSPPAPKSNRPPPVLGNLWIGPSGVGLTGQW